ncbi:MAG: N-glycosylase/DNA lyase [Candidatus Aenigmarchaeota archaeon]|nr:N-glycosylase/DNA lyase [Candidatus Aenigmarchaeota archaeon]
MDKIDLIEKIKETKSTPIAQKIKERTNAFDNLNQQSNDKWFSELCFCILTANFNAKGAIKIQENLFFNFAVLPQNELEKQLRQFGHRFPNKRAEFIFEAQKYSHNIKTIITFLNEQDARTWLVKNIKGIGMKEASHFLRNVGYCNSAIIDFHIIDILIKHNIIQRPKTLNQKTYEKIEEELRKIASECDLNLSQLDLYLWYLETETVLK